MNVIRIVLIAALLVGPWASLVLAGDTAEPADNTSPSHSREQCAVSQTPDLSGLNGQTGWIGIRVAAVSEAMGKQLRLPPRTGLTVVNLIEDGPADKAGVKRYDVIATVNGKPAGSKPEAFVDRIVEQKPGQRLRLELIRGGERIKKTVPVARPRTLGEVRYKYDANGQPVKDVSAVQAKVYRKVNDRWVIESDPNRVQKLLGRRNEAFTQIANSEAGQAEPTAETVVWTDMQDNRWLVNRSGNELTVIKEPVEANLSADGQAPDDDAGVWTKTYDSGAEFRKADPNAYTQYQRLVLNQRYLWQASQQRLNSQVFKVPEPAEEAEHAAVPLDAGEDVPPPADGKKQDETAPKPTAKRRIATEIHPATPAAKNLAKADGVKTGRLSDTGVPDSEATVKGKLTGATRTEMMDEIRKLLAEVEELKALIESHKQPGERYVVDQGGGVTVIRRVDGAEIRREFVNLKDFAEEAPQQYKRYRALQKAAQAN